MSENQNPNIKNTVIENNMSDWFDNIVKQLFTYLTTRSKREYAAWAGLTFLVWSLYTTLLFAGATFPLFDFFAVGYKSFIEDYFGEGKVAIVMIYAYISYILLSYSKTGNISYKNIGIAIYLFLLGCGVTLSTAFTLGNGAAYGLLALALTPVIRIVQASFYTVGLFSTVKVATKPVRKSMGFDVDYSTNKKAQPVVNEQVKEEIVDRMKQEDQKQEENIDDILDSMLGDKNQKQARTESAYTHTYTQDDSNDSMSFSSIRGAKTTKTSIDYFESLGLRDVEYFTTQDVIDATGFAPAGAEQIISEMKAKGQVRYMPEKGKWRVNALASY